MWQAVVNICSIIRQLSFGEGDLGGVVEESCDVHISYCMASLGKSLVDMALFLAAIIALIFLRRSSAS